MSDTVAGLVAARWGGDHRPGLWCGDAEGAALSDHEVAAGAAARAALLPPDAPPHVGVLLDNTPEYPLWLAGAAVVGVNPTRRGPSWPGTSCTPSAGSWSPKTPTSPSSRASTCPACDCWSPAPRSTPACSPRTRTRAPTPPAPPPSDRLMLYFTSGSTSAPKAAICTQGRLAAAGRSLASQFGVGPDDVHYVCMPMFHGNAVIADRGAGGRAGWRCGGGSRRRGSSRTYGATVRRTSRTWAGRSSTCSPPSRAPTTGSTRCGSASARRRFGVRWWRDTARRRAARPCSGRQGRRRGRSGGARPGRARSRDARGVPASRVRRRRTAAQRGRGDRGAGEPAAQRYRLQAASARSVALTHLARHARHDVLPGHLRTCRCRARNCS
ncbi:AMP-binding protein [Streptomyces sp. NPDC102395]|uniref:AMP-binding protein n=1 Tax=Streptomyces sp. NPDC102395 TaxID=3366168 RepID=UPI0038007094